MEQHEEDGGRNAISGQRQPRHQLDYSGPLPVNRLEGHVAIVTGSTRGIGRATAEMFAAEGAKVLVTGRNRDAGQDVEKAIRSAGGEALYFPTDVEREGDVQAAVDEAVRAFGKLTILVNNAAPTDLMASGQVDGPIAELTTERWGRLMLGTLTSVFWSCKYAIPAMINAGKGSIVNISSSAAIRGWTGIDAYTAGKAGMNGLTRSLAVEYGGANIRCNSIVTGVVMPGGDDGSPFAETVKRLQVLRIGQPSDIANAATYLASDEASFVTGVLLPVDGGLTCSVKMDVSATMRDMQPT
jgi:NAD(P)-dependent dehydrogenase (short-subunit alcohol dehydrogenase family)